jgi:GNAT superfamily N-acetyltransferase
VVDGRERDQLAYVALDEAKQIVGFASSGPQRSQVHGFDAELYDIFLLPDVQRRGIGRRLVKTLGEVMLDRGFSSLSVWVVAENPSCKFCSALGATPVAERIIDLEGLSLPAVAYGWPSLSTIL